MSHEELQARYDLLVKYTTRMRAYQVKYDMFKNEKDKNNLLRYQRLVDGLLAAEKVTVDSTQLQIL